jgi:hypothetical protein
MAAKSTPRIRASITAYSTDVAARCSAIIRKNLRIFRPSTIARGIQNVSATLCRTLGPRRPMSRIYTGGEHCGRPWAGGVRLIIGIIVAIGD